MRRCSHGRPPRAARRRALEAAANRLRNPARSGIARARETITRAVTRATSRAAAGEDRATAGQRAPNRAFETPHRGFRGAPCVGAAARAREPAPGYQRIVGELAAVGVRVSATTVAKILRQASVSPAGARAQLSWRHFLRAHADSIIACDFFSVETLWLGRLYVLFFLELGSRQVHVAGCTANPDGSWVTQQARQLTWSLPERATPARFLIHD